MNLLLVLVLAGVALAHGNHDSTKPSNLNWEQWHMVEEHGLDVYDGDTLFKIHDLTNSGEWSKNDILNLYGLLRELIVGDGSGMGQHDHSQEVFTQENKDEVVNTILDLIDSNKDGKVSLEEFREFYKKGNKLPDFGYGQGHHLDFESEYEEHHWLEYHQDQDPDVLVKHKEDIEHELLHHEHEIDVSHDENIDRRETFKNYLSKVRLQNLTPKYSK